MRPLIGITASAQTDVLDHGTFRRYVLSRSYTRAVEAAGGTAIVLAPQLQAIEQLAEMLDGLLLSGGADVDPARYGDNAVHTETYGVDGERDAFELAIFDAMLERNKPVFGICRGIQVLNVALGGTLIQDVPSEHPGAAEIGHRQHERKLADSDVGHSVAATNDHLFPIFENGNLGVNSFHHQAIRDLSPKLAAVAYSPDGLIEAVAMSDNPAVFGVQWHPELMFERHPEHLKPFSRLVEAATSRKLTIATY
jgi:putative glutamine amidotransferase